LDTPADRHDSKERFTSRATDYVAGRPGYPKQVIGVLADHIGFDGTWKVADVGAGTGISTRRFLEAGNTVIAVEPNRAMRDAAAAALGPVDNLEIVEGSAEATGLPDASIDLVVAAQAFHWFDHPGFFAEARRILTPRGRVLLMWNQRLPSATPFATGFERIVENFCLEKRHDRHGLNATNLSQWFEKGTFTHDELSNDQMQDFDSIASRLASSSYMPTRGHERFEPMMAALRELFDRHQQNGVVILPHVTELYLGRPREQA
jgi:SAM-dependent methyltransferase